MLNLFRGRDQQPLSLENVDPQAQQRRRLQRTRSPRRAPRQAEEQQAAAPLPSGIPPEGRVVVTISSQYGSGGSEIGRIVANETGLLYLDHEIIGEVARRLGINVEQATNLDEQTVGAVRHILDALQSSSFLSLNLAWLLNPARPPAYSQELVYWYLTRRVILEMASEGNAVIIGRGSQFLLHEAPRTVHIYIFAPLEQRITNVMEHVHVSRQAAERMVKHRDYEHEAYLRRYYNSQQDRPELYHLLINTGLFPFDLAAQLIQETLPLVGAFSGAEGTSAPSKTTVALGEEPPERPGEADVAEEKTGTQES
jgi:cytidylate kinase